VTITFAHAGTAYGDAQTMGDFAKGGGNSISGSAIFTTPGPATFYGDAGTMSGFASGGGNTLTGAANADNVMYGDARTLSGHAGGGGNTLIGAAGLSFLPGVVTNTMYGDGHDLQGLASGGGNTLVSGQNANDTMWGDAAVAASTAHTRANTFVFAPSNGHDTIMDFHSGRDHIDLQGFGFSSFQQIQPLFQQTSGGLDIVFDAKNGILLSGVSQVAAGDFVFS
jgi:hypothetical protein